MNGYIITNSKVEHTLPPQVYFHTFTKTAKPPVRAHASDAGADLFADESVIIPPGTGKLVGTGLGFKTPEGYALLVEPRSSQRANFSVGHLGSGVIDSGYRGELKVYLFNHSDYNDYEVVAGVTKIAQILFVPIITPIFTPAWYDAERGDNGFGSTGN